MVKIFTFRFNLRQMFTNIDPWFTMLEKYQLNLVLKLYNFFRIIDGTYSFKYTSNFQNFPQKHSNRN